MNSALPKQNAGEFVSTERANKVLDDISRECANLVRPSELVLWHLQKLSFYPLIDTCLGSTLHCNRQTQMWGGRVKGMHDSPVYFFASLYEFIRVLQ